MDDLIGGKPCFRDTAVCHNVNWNQAIPEKQNGIGETPIPLCGL
jgi:hypothetical protein